MPQTSNADSAIEAVMHAIHSLLETRDSVIVAIDGPCASGKTTFTAALQAKTGGTVIHIDDFFLRPEQRTEARLQTPGENVDHERFLEEVLLPLRGKRAFSYKPYDCHTGAFKAPIAVHPARLFIVEGSYSCHSSLWDSYDLRIFLQVQPEVQQQRILLRNGASGLKNFTEKWIPLENQYFSAFDIAARCDLRLSLRECLTTQKATQ